MSRWSYCRAGSRYRKGRRGIDYADLGTWTRQRPGQVIACEQLGASWLPFTELARVNGMRGKGTEVYWLSTGLPVKSQLPLLLGESGQMMEVG